jgi:hypothetical protein
MRHGFADLMLQLLRTIGGWSEIHCGARFAAGVSDPACGEGSVLTFVPEGESGARALTFYCHIVLPHNTAADPVAGAH